MPDGGIDEQTLTLLWQIYTSNCFGVALIGATFWEVLITLEDEVRLFWRREARFSPQCLLLTSTRICMVAYSILQITQFLPQPTCFRYRLIEVLQGAMIAATFIQIALFSALRISALYNRNLILFLVVFVLGLAPVATNLYTLSRENYVQVGNECFNPNYESDSVARALVLMTRVPLIFADFLVLVLTWAKTYQQIMSSRRFGIPVPLSTCLVRDGTFYFLCLLTLNILQIALHTTSAGAPVSTIVLVFPSILVNRFMINLKNAGSPTDFTLPGNLTTFGAVSTPRFQLSSEFVGNMGQPLHHGKSTSTFEWYDDAADSDEGVVGDSSSIHQETEMKILCDGPAVTNVVPSASSSRDI